MKSAIFAEHMKPRGRKAELADKLGIERSNITRWIEDGVPAERVLDVERYTGVPRTAIRSDLYPTHAPAPKAEAAAQ